MSKRMWGTAFNGSSPKPSYREKEWISPEEREQQKAKRAEEIRKLHERSDIARYKAMIKKYGRKGAVRLGVPQSFLDELDARKAKEAARREKNEAKRLRRNIASA